MDSAPLRLDDPNLDLTNKLFDEFGSVPCLCTEYYDEAVIRL
jgi:hypothetical protein